MEFDETFLLALGLDPEPNYAYPANPDMLIQKSGETPVPNLEMTEEQRRILISALLGLSAVDAPVEMPPTDDYLDLFDKP
jgi:hypothetical protein